MGTLTWNFEVQPTPLSRTYHLRIRYRQRDAPDVVVVAPDLAELSGGRDIPHVYQQKPVKLCLYLPGSGEWSPDRRLVDTIVPWAILWLFYFEDWLTTGEWNGGGNHPKVRCDGVKKNPIDRRRRH